MLMNEPTNQSEWLKYLVFLLAMYERLGFLCISTSTCYCHLFHKCVMVSDCILLQYHDDGQRYGEHFCVLIHHLLIYIFLVKCLLMYLVHVLIGSVCFYCWVWEFFTHSGYECCVRYVICKCFMVCFFIFLPGDYS